MKKFFLFAAAIAATVSMSAQTYDFSKLNAETDWTISNCTKNTSVTTDAKVYYDIDGGQVLTMVPTAVTSNVEFSITNSGAKSKIFIVNLGASVEFGGKNGVITVKNVNDKVTIRAAAKSEKEEGYAVISAANCTGVNSFADITLPRKNKGAEGADKDGYIWVDMVFTPNASEISIKETNAGIRVASITVGAGNAINETMAQSGVSYNGREIVNANGMNVTVYNVLGKVVATSNSNINMANFANGVYVVRVAGVKGAMKIQK